MVDTLIFKDAGTLTDRDYLSLVREADDIADEYTDAIKVIANFAASTEAGEKLYFKPDDMKKNLIQVMHLLNTEDHRYTSVLRELKMACNTFGQRINEIISEHVSLKDELITLTQIES
jgi:hypothetical protein